MGLLVGRQPKVWADVFTQILVSEDERSAQYQGPAILGSRTRASDFGWVTVPWSFWFSAPQRSLQILGT